MTRLIFDRRQAILGMGAALMMSSAKQAIAADVDFATRLADMERDGRVSGLHALLVSAPCSSITASARMKGWALRSARSRSARRCCTICAR